MAYGWRHVRDFMSQRYFEYHDVHVSPKKSTSVPGRVSCHHDDVQNPISKFTPNIVELIAQHYNT